MKSLEKKITDRIQRGMLELERAKKHLAIARAASVETGDTDLVKINLKNIAYWDGYVSAYEEMKEMLE